MFKLFVLVIMTSTILVSCGAPNGTPTVKDSTPAAPTTADAPAAQTTADTPVVPPAPIVPPTPSAEPTPTAPMPATPTAPMPTTPAAN